MKIDSMVEIMKQLQATVVASRGLQHISENELQAIITEIGECGTKYSQEIMKANAADLALMDKANPKYDRLMLTEQRLADIARDASKVALLPSPVGKVLSQWTEPNGMTITKKSVPFGVIGVVYEARPNVTFDVTVLCLKARSACVLKGGSDAFNTNYEVVKHIHSVLSNHGISTDCVTLLPAGHEAADVMMRAVGLIDVIIPRGSAGLIKTVRNTSLVPVIETGAGVCHTYFHTSGNVDMGADIICNAKTRRVSVCNALDTVIIDRCRLGDLPKLCAPLARHSVIIYADDEAFASLNGNYPNELLQHATEEHFGYEFIDYKMSVKTVADIDEALAFISEKSSKHSESIVADDTEAQARFNADVDAACVYNNLPTSFTDGGQFGFGAEIGISTQKLHARGPMGLPEITTYKYVITGNGQIRK